MKVIIKKKISHPIRKAKRLEKAKQLSSAGLKYYTFVWPEKEFIKIVALAEKENKKPNVFIWEYLENNLLNKGK